MRKRVCAMCCTLALCVSLLACGVKVVDLTDPQASFEPLEAKVETGDDEKFGAMLNINMLENGDFSDGTTNWDTYITSGGSAMYQVLNEAGVLKIVKTGTLDYSVQLYYDGFKLLNGGVYEVSLDIDSTIARRVGARIQLNGGDYYGYFEDDAQVVEGPQHLSWTFTMEQDSDLAPRFCLNLGTPKEGEPLPEHTVTVDNVEIKLIDDSGVIKDEVEDLSRNVNLNQVGFLPESRKTAVVRSREIESEYQILNEKGEVVCKGSLTGPVKAEAADELVYQADFSEFNTPGTYTLKVSNGDESFPFTISNDVYDELLKVSFLFLYKQRCGMEIDEAVAGEVAHPVCHNTPALIYGTNEYIDVSGGWHDAGDYGRYVVPGATTVADLLLTYEDFPKLWEKDDIGIPESGNGIPDILDEARYELDWMLKMQDPATGGVYHKVSCRDFPEFVMPEEETDELVVSPVSLTATADFAAVMAMASSVYEPFDKEFAVKALEVSKKAWDYLEANPKARSFKNPSEILTGEYPDSEDLDERYWAAAELLKITGEQKYRDCCEDAIDKFVSFGFGWSSMGSYANRTYLSLDSSLQNPELVEKITKKIRQKAIEYRDNTIKDGYMCDLGGGINYCWGSNLSVCANARQMLLTAKYAPDIEGLDVAAYDQVSYLLGQNALSYSFLSGFGSLYPIHAHHRPSIATNSVIKGMVIGGPDSAYEDPYAKAVLSGLPAAKSYADNSQSFSTNEVTIYWNSPFIYLLSSIM